MDLFDTSRLEEKSNLLIGVIGYDYVKRNKQLSIIINILINDGAIIKDKVITNDESRVIFTYKGVDLILTAVSPKLSLKGRRYHYLFVDLNCYEEDNFIELFKRYIHPIVINYNVKQELKNLDNQPRVFLF